MSVRRKSRRRGGTRRRAAPGRSHHTYADFMAQAWLMETDAAERYADFADQMEVHNNPEVAQLFRDLSQIEARHAARILAEMGWSEPPRAVRAWRWDSPEPPETAAVTELHYLMQPYHALEIALKNEQRAERFLARIAQERSAPAAVRKTAAAMAKEERAHVRLVRDWMKRVPAPQADWSHDPDPPVLSD